MQNTQHVQCNMLTHSGSGGQPCGQCLDHDQECLFQARKRPRRKAGSGHDTVAQRLYRLESILARTSDSAHSSCHVHPSTSPASSSVAYGSSVATVITQSEPACQPVPSTEPSRVTTSPVLSQVVQRNRSPVATTEPTQNAALEEVMRQDESSPSMQPSSLPQFNVSVAMSSNNLRSRSTSSIQEISETVAYQNQTTAHDSHSSTNGIEQPHFNRQEDPSLDSNEMVR